MYATEQPPVATQEDLDALQAGILARIPAPPSPPDLSDFATIEALTALQQSIAAQIAGLPSPDGAAGPSFDALYASDWAKLASYMNGVGAGSGDAHEPITFGVKARTIDTSIPLRSGHRLIGGQGPAREFGTGAVWKAKAGLTSFFAQVANSQSYPASTGVRDFYAESIQFTGSVPVLPPHDISKGFDANNAVYYTTFHNCGFVGTPLLVGWADGLTLTGVTHVNSIVSEFIRYGGANMMLCVGGGLSYMDSNKAAWLTAGKPFIETWAKQWEIGTIMISARQTAYGLLVSGGENGRCSETFFDAPDSNPTQGAAARITGGTSLAFGGCSFHNNHGIAALSGASDITVAGNVFNNCPEILTISAAFTGHVTLGFNAYSNSSKTVKVSSLSQIACDDPRITITDLTGKTLRAATA